MISTPLIIGHRGASAVAPENTIASFSRALADGADGIEFDVRLSRDRVPVVIHDANLKRTARIDRLVAELSAAELQQCDASNGFTKPASANERHAHAIPNLAQVFQLFEHTDSLLYLEMKANTDDGTSLVETVAREINDAKIGAQVIVSSFNLELVALIKQLDPAIRTAALFEPKLSRPLSTLRRLKMIDIALEHRADELALHHTLVTPRALDRAKQFGLPVVVWTVDGLNWIERARRLGIRALISNNPAAMVAERNR